VCVCVCVSVCGCWGGCRYPETDESVNPQNIGFPDLASGGREDGLATTDSVGSEEERRRERQRGRARGREGRRERERWV
jgi:hypothetical protein